MMSMLGQLLETRFKLTMHKGSREMPVYELTAVGDGAKLKRVNQATDRPDGYPALSDNPVSERAIVRGHVTSRLINVDMDTIITQLRPFLDRPVIDRTGLTGRYDVLLHYLQGSALRDGGPSLIEAVQSQLGLRLESKRGPVDVWIVDHAEKVPAEN